MPLALLVHPGVLGLRRLARHRRVAHLELRKPSAFRIRTHFARMAALVGLACATVALQPPLALRLRQRLPLGAGESQRGEQVEVVG